jgi:2-aminoethylphosphonate-pyruvate transaminase
MPELRRDFLRHGYARPARSACPVNVSRLDAELATLALEAGAPGGALAIYEADAPDTVCRLEYLSGASPYVREHLVAPLQSLITQVTGTPVLLFKDKCNLKQPGGGAFPPHQDIAAYRHFNTSYQITAAVMLDAATAANGALEMAHAWTDAPGGRMQPTPRGALPILPCHEGSRRHGEILDEVSARFSWHTIEAEAGDLLLFDSFVPHRSQVNRTGRPRRIMFFTFASGTDGDLYEAYYRTKRATPDDPIFHVATPTMRSARPPPERLFTPGPLSTSDTVRAAANRDLGSRSAEANELTARLQRAIATIADCDDRMAVIPLAGSGTGAVEAMLASLLAGADHVLVLENGVYSRRMTEICRRLRLRHSVLACDPMMAVPLAAVRARVEALGDVTHIAAVHFETGLGVLNDLPALQAYCAARGIRLLVDAVSTFGVLPLDYTDGALAAVAITANKCLHGLPGLAFVLADRDALRRVSEPRTLSLDLHAQQCALERTGQWRFTPPLQAMLALDRAIDEFQRGGGRTARHARYLRLHRQLLAGMERLGFVPLVAAAWRAPIITTFVPVQRRALDIDGLFTYLGARGMHIYPAAPETAGAFRIGVMGELSPQDIDRLLHATALWQANHD